MINFNTATKQEITQYLSNPTKESDDELFALALKIRRENFGNKVYMRGLVEVSSFCKNDCYYCGLRRSNNTAVRYRLTHEQILDCCKIGYDLGFRTFVMQGGEDASISDSWLVPLVSEIRQRYTDAAITLSLGERSRESYQALYNVGANRYLLRHETANDEHYSQLHPKELSLKIRKQCLYDLKEIGFQTGAGFLVGSPYQTMEHLAEDILFLRELQPQMVGIGPFLPHSATPFADFPAGDVELTLRMVAITRILLPKANLPATTALATLAKDGRERGFQVGANIVMPNLSPSEYRDAYMLYDGKLNTGAEAAEGLRALKVKIEAAGFVADMGRGDFVK